MLPRLTPVAAEKQPQPSTTLPQVSSQVETTEASVRARLYSIAATNLLANTPAAIVLGGVSYGPGYLSGSAFQAPLKGVYLACGRLGAPAFGIVLGALWIAFFVNGVEWSRASLGGIPALAPVGLAHVDQVALNAGDLLDLRASSTVALVTGGAVPDGSSLAVHLLSAG